MRILVAYGGSSHSEDALRFADFLASGPDDTIIALTVIRRGQSRDEAAITSQ